MKKNYLKIFLFLAITVVNAQIETSFEQSERFYLEASINNLNGWFLGGGHINNAIIDSEHAASGSQSLKLGNEICNDSPFIYYPDINVIGDKNIEIKLFIPSAPVEHVIFEVGAASYDINDSPYGFFFAIESDEFKVGEFNQNNGNIDYTNTDAFIERDTWVTVRAEAKFSERKIVYYLNDNEVAVFALTSFYSNDIDRINFGVRNNNIGNVFLDDLKISSITLNVAENEFSKNFTLYPNPTSGEITLVSSKKETEPFDIVITNVLGQKVMTLEKQLHEENSIDINTLNNGVYLMQISSGSKTAVKRFVKN